MVAIEDGGTLWWEEIRPEEYGRTAFMRRTPDGDVIEMFSAQDGEPAPLGHVGEWLPVGNGAVVAAGDGGHRLYLLRPKRPPQPLVLPPLALPRGSEERADCYTDLICRPGTGEVWCVRQSQRGEVAEWSIVAVPLDGTLRVRTRLTTTECVCAPRPSPDGTLLAWLAWEPPQMPWDGSLLHVGRITSHDLTEVKTVLGGPVEAVFQPEWATPDSLYVISDRSRWWNPYQVWLDGTLRPLCLLPEEFGWPQSGPALSTYGELTGGQLAVLHGVGHWRLDLLDPDDGLLTPLDLPYSAWQPSLRTNGSMIAGVAGSPTRAAAVVLVDTTNGRHNVIRRSIPSPPTEYLPRAYPETFIARDGHEVHAVVYPPHNPQIQAGSHERIPYLLIPSECPAVSIAQCIT